MKPRYLTKSRFKTGLECPNKVFFGNDKRYANQNEEDSFLEALAEGGFQVEALARMAYPEGKFIEAEHYEYDKAHDETEELLKARDVVLFEAGFLTDGLFIRTDILEKKGNTIRIIEVKAKSYDPNDDYEFIGKRGGLQGGWKSYLFDLAFQKYVVSLLYPDYRIEAWLMLADKSKKTSIDGLNQLIRIPAGKDVDPRKDVQILFNDVSEIGESVLSTVNITDIIQDIISGKYSYHDSLNFLEAVALLRQVRQENTYPAWPTEYSPCRNCEFKTTEEDKAKGKLSGFEYCFRRQHHWKDEDFEKPNILEIWNFRGGNKLMEEDKLFMSDVDESDIVNGEPKPELSTSERQWLQIQKAADGDVSFWVDEEGLKRKMDEWVFPLHFIDFETSMVALPFTKGRRPYEQTAFQFSHHTVYEDGRIEHHSEYLNTMAGKFPNFDFARALKDALGNDKGSVFRFATHENTIVNAIIEQLRDSNEPDKDKLTEFLQEISHAKNDSTIRWEGTRDMIDLCDIIKKYYYNPLTKGSNSIKAVLPASLSSSPYLREKYSKPIGQINLTSENFGADHVWLTEKDGQVINPYKTLPPIFEEWTEEQLKSIVSGMDKVSEGGAALTAYSKLQFTDMGEEERELLNASLLRYCELDTLAMVMIYEHLRYDIVEQMDNE